MPTARPLVSRCTVEALSGEETEEPLLKSADAATAEWYSRLMMRLKRLDSQKGKNGMRVMGEAAYLGSSSTAQPSEQPLSSRTTTTGGFHEALHGSEVQSARTLEPTPPVSARQRRGVSYTDMGALRQSGASSSSGGGGISGLAARLDALSQECAASEALLDVTTASFGKRPADSVSFRPSQAELEAPMPAGMAGVRSGGRAALSRANDNFKELEASFKMVSDLPSREERRERRASAFEGRTWDTDEEFLDLTQEALGLSAFD